MIPGCIAGQGGRVPARRLGMLAAVGLVLALATCARGAAVARFEFVDENRVERVEMRSEVETVYFRLADVALAVDAIRYWNPMNSKMTLSVGEHRIAISRDSRFAVLDKQVENLRAPAIFRRNEFWVPLGFLAGPLGRAMNAEFEWDPDEKVVYVRGLRPAIETLELLRSADGTVVELGLTGRTAFTALSRTRGTIEVMFPGARLLDSLAVTEETEHVSDVVLEESPDGVRAEIAVTGRAGSYDARLLSDPYRVEVLVRSGYERAALAPELREVKHLLPEATDVLGRPGGGTQIVMIDPGHGGTDPGSVGRSGLEEKDVALSLARELSSALQSRGFYAFMTRSSDSYVPEHRRAEIANLAVADIFVSIQCGAWYSGWASGFSVCYYQPPRSPSEPGRVSEGRGLPRSGSRSSNPVKDELRWERLQEDHIGESRVLARAIRSSMRDGLALHDRGVTGRSVGVLSGCAMPAVQIEVGFITNRDEEALFSDRNFLRDVARAIADGVAAYRADVEERNR